MPAQRQEAAMKGAATRKRNKEARDKKREEALIYRDGLKEKISAMEARLEILNTQEIMGELAYSLTDNRLLRDGLFKVPSERISVSSRKS